MMSDVRFMGFRSDPYSFLNYTDLKIGKECFCATSNYGLILADHLKNGIYSVRNKKNLYYRSEPVFRIKAPIERF